MTEQEQIEEMTKEIEKAKQHIWASVMPQADDEDYLWHSRAIAEHLMLQGYRNADEVRKETAEKILEKIKNSFWMNRNNRYALKLWLKEQFGVEIKE